MCRYMLQIEHSLYQYGDAGLIRFNIKSWRRVLIESVFRNPGIQHNVFNIRN